MKYSMINQLLLPVLIAGLGVIPAGRVTAQPFTIIHTFSSHNFSSSPNDGEYPMAGVIISGSTLYGATYDGGAHDYGAVYAVNVNGSGYTNLYSFADYYNGIFPDGIFPQADLILSGNTLYGTASQGGTHGYGTIFAVNTNGTGFTNLYNFTDGNDGGNPQVRLTISGNTLYGTTENGGSSSNGTVFAVNTDGSGYTNLYSFTGGHDGANPQAGLIISGNTLYGTTAYGGSSGCGTVFAINADGSGFTTLYNFTEGRNDGGCPFAGLILSGNTLYGTTEYGGSSGNGTLFAINTNGSGFRNLHSFNYESDGAYLVASLILSGNTLYGTTTYGGSSGNGNGTAFAINTNGTGFTVLHSFSATDPNTSTNNDGANPQASLILSGNTLYGTAAYGGAYGGGTVFSIFLPLAVTTTVLPNGTNATTYSQTLAVSHGQTPYAWTIISGALPSGLALATNGVISGTPTTSGTFNFTVQVTDASSATATQALSLMVGAPPSAEIIQPNTNSIAVATGDNVTFTVSAAGTGPFRYHWQFNGTNLPGNIITTVAGGNGANYSGDGGLATNASLNNPFGVAVDTSGNIFIADNYNQSIREVGVNGIITTVAGNGIYGYLGDNGLATNASLAYPTGVAADASGNLFIVDQGNNVIRKVDASGIITTVAGSGQGYSGDGGAAINAEFNSPYGVAVDVSGNLFIADAGNSVIRRVDTNGIITTVAGNGNNGYSGDGGPATNASLSQAEGVAVDAFGNLFIADQSNEVIRMVDTNGIITTVAGNGNYGYTGDAGPATNASFTQPEGVAVDASGNLFIADTVDSAIREVGADGIITTVAGNGNYGYSGDGGPATNASLSLPTGVAVDASGNLFIADQPKNCIREVTSGPTLTLTTVGQNNAGNYDVVVSSPYGSVTSSVVNLTVTLPLALAAPHLSVANNQFSFQLSGPSGSNYVLEVSTNLLNWSPVSTSTIPISGSINVSNAISGYNRGFYRVHLQ